MKINWPARVAPQSLLAFWPLAVVALACISMALFGDTAGTWGRYERAAVEAGELWRIVTAHVVHLDTRHLLLNLAGLAVVTALLAGIMDVRDWITAVLLSAVAVVAGLYLLDPGIQWYVGLSGVLHGVLACGAMVFLRRRDGFGLVVAIVLIAKLAWEHWAGPLPLAGDATPVVIQAHLYGAIGGILAGLPRMGAPIADRSAGQVPRE